MYCIVVVAVVVVVVVVALYYSQKIIRNISHKKKRIFKQSLTVHKRLKHKFNNFLLLNINFERRFIEFV